jgi:pimeloyl-ACP methyl ester carboxylesterase
MRSLKVLKAARPLLLAIAILLVGFTFEKYERAGTSAFVDSSQKATGESKFAKLDGARVHYVNYGKGEEALILIHGWTQSVDAWRDQVEDFARRNRVIAIDLPGHGLSDKPEGAKGQEQGPKGEGQGAKGKSEAFYSMDHFARAIEAVMREAKVKRAVLVGHSMGTPVARQFYRKYPEKTLAIVIVDGSLRPFPKAMVDQMLAGLRAPNYRDAVTQLMNTISGPNLSAEVKGRISSAANNTPQYVVVSAFAGMAEDSIWGEDKINVPVLAIMAKSPLLPPNVEESYRALAPKLDLQMWDGVGHFIMMEKPKEFNAAVIAWLDKNGLLKK